MEKFVNAIIVLIYGVIMIPFAIIWFVSMIFIGVLDVINDDDVVSMVYDFGVKTINKITKMFGVEDEDF